jgi:hypothetical protein
MPKLQWDSTLETCLQRNKNALLIAGQPPYWRFDEGLGAGLVPCLDHEDIISMLEEITPGPDRIETVPGCRSFRLLYGSDPYRVDMLGEPTTLAVVLTRLPLDAPALLREGSGWYQGWNADVPEMNWNELLGSAKHFGGDALVSPGSPPFIWSSWGLHAFDVAPLSDDVVCSMIDQITPPPELRVQRQGLVTFDVRLSQVSDEFRAEVFGYPSPTLALLIRSKSESPLS